MPVNYIKLGRRIAQYRNTRDLTQEQLGESVFLTGLYVSRIETAVRRPSLDTLVDIANVLNVSVDVLLQDCLDHKDSPLYHEIAESLGNCSELESTILLRNLKNLKEVLQDLGI